jgi:hypothetical protein
VREACKKTRGSTFEKVREGERCGRTYLGSSTTSNDMRVLDRPLDDHDGIVQTPLNLSNELISPTPQDHRARLRLRAAFEQIEPLPSDLPLLKLATPPEMLVLDVGARRLDGAADGLDDPSKVVGRNPTGAEDVAVGKVLGGKVANGKLGEDDFGAGGDDGFELLVDDGPFGVDDGLVFLQEGRSWGGKRR